MSNLNNVQGHNISLTVGEELSRKEIVETIAAIGRDTEYGRGTTVLVRGNMGNGKTQIERDLAKLFPKHKRVFLDCANAMEGDIQLPVIIRNEGENEHVKYAPNQIFGVHDPDNPYIVMLDEPLKASKSVKKMLMPVAMERKAANLPFHPDTIVVMTGNKDGENLGDQLLAHEAQRILELTMKNLSKEDVIEYGSNNGWHPTVLAFIGEHGNQLHQSWEEVSDHNDNMYIYHPQAQRIKFWTPRGAEECSKFVHMYDRGGLDKKKLRSALSSRVGPAASRLLMTYIEMAKDIPTTADIKSDPHGCLVPTNTSAQFMLSAMALSTVEKNWVDQWMDYLARLDINVQAMFALCVKEDSHSKNGLMMRSEKFRNWCHKNSHLFN